MAQRKALLRRAILSMAAVLAVVIGLAWYWLLPVMVSAPTLAGSLQSGALEWQGHSRSYQIYLPVTVSQRPPLVLVFHGSMGNSELARAAYAYEFERLADQHGFVVAFPDGFEDHFNGCRKRGPYAANTQNIDDVGFMRALVSRLARDYAVDTGAVFATGISNGGQMALRLALEAPDLVAAVAPVATNLPTPDNMGCSQSGEPVSLLLMNGTDDPMNPDAGGTVALYGLVGDRGTVQSSQDTVRYWADLAGYTSAPQQRQLEDRDSDDQSHIEVQLWQRSGAESVALYTVVGGGHNTPHPVMRAPRLLGGNNADVVAAEEIWSFFEFVRNKRSAATAH